MFYSVITKKHSDINMNNCSAMNSPVAACLAVHFKTRYVVWSVDVPLISQNGWTVLQSNTFRTCWFLSKGAAHSELRLRGTRGHSYWWTEARRDGGSYKIAPQTSRHRELWLPHDPTIPLPGVNQEPRAVETERKEWVCEISKVVLGGLVQGWDVP